MLDDQNEKNTSLTNQSKQETIETKSIDTGEQTKITPKIEAIVKNIKGEDIIAVMNVGEYMRKTLKSVNAPGPDFSKTAEEILEKKQFNGCNEAGTVAATLLRAKGISTTYIQALDIQALENFPKEHNRFGHVFLEVELNNNKKIINSTTGEITDTLPNNFIEGARGLDSWDIGLKNGKDDLDKLFFKKYDELHPKI